MWHFEKFLFNSIIFALWYPDPSTSPNVPVSRQYDKGVGVGDPFHMLLFASDMYCFEIFFSSKNKDKREKKEYYFFFKDMLILCF